MRAAILLGVSEYSELNDLSPVVNDVLAMRALLDATGRYQRILQLSERLSAEPTKRAILDYLSEFSTKDVDELFFYYSGHGERLEDRLSFQMSDWSQGRARTGSIQNDEMDRWLKDLGPRVAVKVIDCCYAGVPYIKGENEIKSLIHPAGGTFRACYFFLSSRFDQVSRVNQGEKPLSLYTDKFLEALLSLEDGEVRYQQLVDRIGDLLADDDQEPQFVTQGNARHVFCEVSKGLRRSLRSFRGEMRQGVEVPDQVSRTEAQILEAVQRDAEKCITRSEAEDVLTKVEESLKKLVSHEAIESFYELSVRFPSWDDDDVAGEEQIGKWFKREGRQFFGRATEAEPAPRNPATSLDWSLPKKPFVTGFVSDAGLKYDRVLASAEPKFPNLNKWEFVALILWSDRSAAVFTYSLEVRSFTWGRFDLPEKAPWMRRFFSRKELELIPSFVEKLLLRFWEKVHNDIQEKFS